MNTSGLLQSKWSAGLYNSKWSSGLFEVSEVLTLQETWSIHDSINLPKIEFIAYIYKYYKYLKYKKIFSA